MGGDQSPGEETILDQRINALVQPKIRMSALPPKTDMEWRDGNVRFVPTADIRDDVNEKERPPLRRSLKKSSETFATLPWISE